MYRITTVLLTSMVMVAVFGCDGAKKQKMAGPAETEPEPAALEDIAPTEQPEAQIADQPTTAGADEPNVEKVTPDEPAGELAAQRPYVHVVQPGDTLYKLARMYYNDQRMWRKIWEANKDKVPDKNKLAVGIELLIP